MITVISRVREVFCILLLQRQGRVQYASMEFLTESTGTRGHQTANFARESNPATPRGKKNKKQAT